MSDTQEQVKQPPDRFSPFGTDLFGQTINQSSDTSSIVARRFIVPPFTVLSTREGEWQSRKSAWLGIGIKSEVGRTIDGPNMFEKTEDDGGVSIFDPVLCEVIYTWFSGPGAQIVDPFAGGSVRGVVASLLGRKYWGGELREEQVIANREQVAALCPTNKPEYVCGDSTVTLAQAPDADLIFSCPPYGDLEVYSNLPADISNMKWDDFLAAYQKIIRAACARLKNDRFACFVIGDFRDPAGHYRNFVSETINAFLAGGLKLYNEAILMTSVWSAACRVTKQFNAGRKFAKVHQNVLVFVKGDWKKAALAASEDQVEEKQGALQAGQTSLILEEQ